MRNKLKYIVFFFLTVFVASQVLHLGHAAEHFHEFSEISDSVNSELKASKYQDNFKDAFQLQKSGKHHHCLICSNYQYHFTIWKTDVFWDFINSICLNDVSNRFSIPAGTPDYFLLGSIILRGPPIYPLH